METTFAETNRLLIGERGRVGMVCMSGVATDDTIKHFFRDMIERSALIGSLENRKDYRARISAPIRRTQAAMLQREVMTPEATPARIGKSVRSADGAESG